MSTAHKTRSRRKPRVVAVVGSEWLARVVRHLFEQADELEVFVMGPTIAALASEVVRLAPDILVAALSSRRGERAVAIAGLRRAIRASTRVVWIESDADGAPERGRLRADVELREDAVVASLVPEVRRLAAETPVARRR